ncbi:MAG: hypothetical protein NC420_11415 [Eubacterium sp.]|nr:hypothetical protein [Eubacterium sp.]MCM1215838.1 hypothetical protein [Lachnospiraceae bacterium]MCM1239218.1 hypothetical protein [Lachnospiraceae bacterium]
MKKSIIKMVVFIAVFIAALFIVGRLMNQGHDNLTMEMASATFPLISMEMDGVVYNQLHGYKESMDVSFQRDTVTALGERRDTDFRIDTYGRNIDGITIEVRSADGSRLVENTELTDYTQRGNVVSGTIALKDLIDKDTEYSLSIQLDTEEERIYYYTRVVWSDSLYVAEKLAYVLDFHSRLYDREAARELTKYLESNARLEDNSSFHRVNIHSSFRQITWGELPVKEVSEPVVQLTDVANQTASFLVDYIVATSPNGRDQTYYQVQEHYRIRYTAERIYLLNYERTMTQIPDRDDMCANDKILLGITAADIPMVESEDGNIVVFEVADQLFSYNIVTNKMAVIFSFYDEENADDRTLYAQHDVKILDVDEGGNVQFAVYGYMNRGRHEGEVGIQLYSYDSDLNTLEEIVYIPYDRTYSVLAAELGQLLYLNREQELYLEVDQTIYGVDLVEKTYYPLIHIDQDGSVHVSDNHKIVVWTDADDIHQSRDLNIRNLSNGDENTIQVREDEVVCPLGFMEEDVIYGVAKREDVVEESLGGAFLPMYKVCISSSDGQLLKEYSQPGIYVTGCQVENNQLILDRVERLESGEYREAVQDHIMNNTEAVSGRNVIVTADIDIYERYVEIQTRAEIDSKSFKMLTPKEVVFEGGRELRLPKAEERERYYVYGPYGVDGIFASPAGAVNLAYGISGVVVDESGECIWLRGNRVLRNQIMAIKEASVTETKDSLAVCLDTIFKFEGLVRNSEYLLGQGYSVMEILENNLEDARILDLKGCNLDALLYYTNRDIPVLALLENGEAVLVTGFNEYNVVIMEPSTGSLYKKGMNDSTEWFEENGNRFITYVRK